MVNKRDRHRDAITRGNGVGKSKIEKVRAIDHLVTCRIALGLVSGADIVAVGLKPAVGNGSVPPLIGFALVRIELGQAAAMGCDTALTEHRRGNERKTEQTKQ